MEATFYPCLENWLEGDIKDTSPHGTPLDIDRVKSDITTLSTEHRKSNEEIAEDLVCKLSDQKCLIRRNTRKYHSFGDPAFEIVREHEGGNRETLFRYVWTLTHCYSHLGIVRFGGCYVTSGENLHIDSRSSCDGNYVVLLGPAKTPSTQPITRVVNVPELNIKEIILCHDDQPGWPLAVALNPDQRRENQMSLLVTTAKTYHLSGLVGNLCRSVLMQVDLHSQQTVAVHEEPNLLIAGLQYVPGGDLVVCTESGWDRIGKAIWVFRSDDLTPLQTIDIANSHMELVQTVQLGPVLSPCRRCVSVIYMSIREALKSGSPSYCYMFPLTGVNFKTLTLRETCRCIILRSCHKSNLDALPLPKTCIRYIYGHCF